MARIHIAVSVAAATFAILIVLHLIQYLDNEREYNVQPHKSLIPDDPSRFEEVIGQDAGEYLLGVGKADITGPVTEINLMGYADPKQLGSGVRQRLYSRAFIIGSTYSLDDRFVYLVLDTQSGDAAIRHGILEGLQKMGGQYSLYGKNNVAVTGTHSHSGPGAWLNYLLPQITSKGFDHQSYQAIVDGALLSIKRAHETLALGTLSFGSTEIEDANINRSLYAYLANPEEERKKYKNSVDKELTLLKFHRRRDDKDIGVLTWFPVHGTSMLGNNTLVTGDNKGVAAYLFEQRIKAQRNDKDDAFVAGFSQSNVGDTSPNVLGAYCEEGPDSGKECRLADSTCGGKNEPCHGRGPFYGLNDAGTKSCFEIGRRQYAGAQSLFETMQSKKTASTPIRGPISAFHTYRDFSNFSFSHPNGTIVRTCPAALGYSFAAGTTDGPGAFDFKQNNSGKANANPLWAAVRDFLHQPNDEQKACQAPKPILLDVGETMNPYQWSPNIVDIQLLRVGQLVIIVSPGEATTMAGRRWKDAIANAAAATLSKTPSAAPLVVLGGPANTYTHYIATEEEYGVQRYEGASTLYGAHTLNAYINLTVSLLPYLTLPITPQGLSSISDAASSPPTRPYTSPLEPLDPGPQPPIYINDSLSFITPVIRDSSGFFASFGDIITDVQAPSKQVYRAGHDTVEASFVGACPRTNLRLEGTYAAIEAVSVPSPTTANPTLLHDTDTEADVEDSKIDLLLRNYAPSQFYLTDEDWALTFNWRRTSTLLATSTATVRWEIGPNTPPGLYRLLYFGDAKGFSGLTPFQGMSGVFEVV